MPIYHGRKNAGVPHLRAFSFERKRMKSAFAGVLCVLVASQAFAQGYVAPMVPVERQQQVQVQVGQSASPMPGVPGPGPVGPGYVPPVSPYGGYVPPSLPHEWLRNGYREQFTRTETHDVFPFRDWQSPAYSLQATTWQPARSDGSYFYPGTGCWQRDYPTGCPQSQWQYPYCYGQHGQHGQHGQQYQYYQPYWRW